MIKWFSRKPSQGRIIFLKCPSMWKKSPAAALFLWSHSITIWWLIEVPVIVFCFAEEIKTVFRDFSWKHTLVEKQTERESCRERGWLWLIMLTFSFRQFWECLWWMNNVWCSQLNYICRALRPGCQHDPEGLKYVLNHNCPPLIQSDICHRKIYIEYVSCWLSVFMWYTFNLCKLMEWLLIRVTLMVQYNPV